MTMEDMAMLAVSRSAVSASPPAILADNQRTCVLMFGNSDRTTLAQVSDHSVEKFIPRPRRDEPESNNNLSTGRRERRGKKRQKKVYFWIFKSQILRNRIFSGLNRNK